MPRPKGSKNKATQAKATSTVTKETATKSTVAPESVEGTLLSYEKMLTSYNEQITGLLSELLEEFDGLKVLVGGATASPAKATSKPAAKKPAVVEEDEPEDDEPEGEPDFDSMSVEELEDFVDENDLDVDLDDYKGLSKKRQAVADAYEEMYSEDEDDDTEDEDDDTEDEDDDWDSPPKAAASKPKSRRR